MYWELFRKAEFEYRFELELKMVTQKLKIWLLFSY